MNFFTSIAIAFLPTSSPQAPYYSLTAKAGSSFISLRLLFSQNHAQAQDFGKYIPPYRGPIRRIIAFNVYMYDSLRALTCKFSTLVTLFLLYTINTLCTRIVNKITKISAKYCIFPHLFLPLLYKQHTISLKNSL